MGLKKKYMPVASKGIIGERRTSSTSSIHQENKPFAAKKLDESTSHIITGGVNFQIRSNIANRKPKNPPAILKNCQNVNKLR